MINKSYEEILEKIIAERGLARDAIEGMVQQKIKQLGDLVSKEGAAHIIANQLGVKIFDGGFGKKLQIKDLVGGMYSVSILGKVMAVYDARTFKTKSGEGRVLSILLGDESGVIRVVFWDDTLILKFEKQEIKENDILKIRQSYAKTNNGFVELHVGSRSSVLLNPPGETIGVVGGRGLVVRNFSRKKLNEIKDGESVEVFGTIVQVFEPRFFLGCKGCGKKLNEGKCAEHGEVDTLKVPVLPFFFDDGTDSVQAVAFREVVSQLYGENLVEGTNFDTIRAALLGKQVVIQGRVTYNAMFNRLDISVNSVRDADALEELGKI